MTDDHDLGPDLVERLASLDDRLRRGDMSTQSIEEELAMLEADAELADLVDCVKVLENRWPRSLAVPAAPQASNAAATLHPALSLAAANGQAGSGQERLRFGKFLIKSELGRGGFGVVLLAEDTVLGRDVALKLPRPELLLDEATKRRFLQEARATAAIDHPHVAAMYEAGEIGSLCYLAAAYCPGETLAHWLARREQPPTPRQAARLIEILAVALHHIHDQGILHRDLKPGNVLLWPASEAAGPDALPFVPKLTDFGLSKVLAESVVESRSSVLLGTPLYMAPEQALGRQDEIGPGADQYALGVILYELLCRRPPFTGTSPLEVLDQVRNTQPPPIRKLRSDVPRDLETICLKCLQKRPQDRYASALALAEDLQRFLEGREIVARPITWPARVYRWCQQPQRLREAGLTVIAIHFAMGGWTTLTAMLLAWGWVPRPNDMTAADVYRYTLSTILFVSPTLAVAGVGMMRGKRWAIQIGMGTGVGLSLVAILLSLSWFHNPFSGLWNDLPGVSLLIYSMLTMLCLLQTVVSVIAAIALRATTPARAVPPTETRALWNS